MLYQVAPAVFAGGGKELEVGRLNAQPGIVRRGQGSGGQGDEQKGSASEGATRGSRGDGGVRPTARRSRNQFEVPPSVDTSVDAARRSACATKAWRERRGCGTPHGEECITGSAEPSSMRAISACMRAVRSMRPANFRPRVSMGSPMRTVTQPLRM